MTHERNSEEVLVATPEWFIEAWQTSNSLAEVAQRIGAKKNTCRVRAWRYKKLGIPLKEFPAPPVEEPDPHYWDKLADYARSFLPAEAPEHDAAPAPGIAEAGHATIPHWER
jgi:hypothetical protein